MNKLWMTALVLCLSASTFAQRYMTRTGKIEFFSATPLENIKAINNESAAVLDSKSGDFVFQVLIKSFKFERELMQEHFNENYMESDKYPKAEYKGKVTNLSAINFSKDGTYNVTTTGTMTMHGTSRNVTIPATVIIKGKTATAEARFKVVPQDYKINIPKLVENKIAKEISVAVDCVMEGK